MWYLWVGKKEELLLYRLKQTLPWPTQHTCKYSSARSSSVRSSSIRSPSVRNSSVRSSSVRSSSGSSCTDSACWRQLLLILHSRGHRGLSFLDNFVRLVLRNWRDQTGWKISSFSLATTLTEKQRKGGGTRPPIYSFVLLCVVALTTFTRTKVSG
jgi:hypothetical protein